MVKVPKGPFLYGDEKTPVTIDHDYWIDKYPVTNEKYRAFIEAGGYESQRYWSEDGWKWKTDHNITDPQYWNDAKCNKPDYPVVGVSYYEAEAYGKWAGKRLPSEKEWEKAARGENGRQFPWGEEFSKDRCNGTDGVLPLLGLLMSLSGGATPVNQYPNGVNPYGCYDMVGNAGEWCADWYDNTNGLRVFRGGCCDYAPPSLRASFRDRSNAHARFKYVGFRLVQDIP